MGLKCRDGPTHGKYSWKRSHKRTISFPLAKSRKEQKHYQGFCSCFFIDVEIPRLWDPTPYKHSRSSIGRGFLVDFCNKMPILKRLHVLVHRAVDCQGGLALRGPLWLWWASTRPRHRVLWPMRTRGDRSTRGRHRRTGGGEMHGKKGSVGLTIIKSMYL